MSLAWALPLLVALSARSAAVSPRPIVWAAQSPRPVACQGAPGLWELSRHTLMQHRCRVLARAQALLLQAPEQARGLAAALLADAPDFSAARVLHGRASLRAGDGATALKELLPLLEADTVTVVDPAALLDGARAALLQKQLASAARFYRTLGNRAALLPDRRQQVVGYLEIAAALLAANQAPVDDVLAYLREARRRSAGSGFTELCAALAAVAWISAGREAEGQGALGEVADPDALAAFAGNGAVWLPDGVLDAVLGLVYERTQPGLSAEHYRALAQGPLAQAPIGQLALRASARPRSGKARARGGR